MRAAHQPDMPAIHIRKAPNVFERCVRVVNTAKRAYIISTRRRIRANSAGMSPGRKTVRNCNNITLPPEFVSPAARSTTGTWPEPAAIVHDHDGRKRTGAVRL